MGEIETRRTTRPARAETAQGVAGARVGLLAVATVVWTLSGVGEARSQAGDGGWGASIEVRRSGSPPSLPRASDNAPAKPPAAVRRVTPHNAPATSSGPAIAAFALAGDGRATRIGFYVDHRIDAAARSLGNPPRVIVDLPEIEFRLPAGAGSSGGGLVTGFRFGLIERGKSRIVIDTVAPVRVARTEVVGPLSTGGWRLEIDVEPITAAELAALELAEAARSIEPVAMAPMKHASPGQSRRPVVVVDAGHGGIDSGAEGVSRLEKDVVLEVAQQVRRALTATSRFDVVMTRETDVFVSLDERLRISQRHQADLFVSIHADSLASKILAKHVRGATVYTLAEQASDELARRMADKENAVDLLAGLPTTTIADDQVRTILIDLMRRESATFSTEFRRGLVAALRPRIAIAKEPFRSGPFKVLRQPGSPAVLIELGYMSNVEDERLMASRAWQEQVAGAIRSAIEEHFRKRPAAKP